MSKASSDTIKIILDDSIHAKDFDKGSLIHKVEFERVLEMISKSIPQTEEEAKRKYLHNTITILGTRGSGKTSFLLSIKEAINGSKRDAKNPGTKSLSDLLVLNIIDPTLIEEKGHVFLTVISSISELVEKRLDEIECDPHKDVKYRRKDWREKLVKLAAGLPSLDGIGHNHTDSWQDAEFVMDNGLKAITASRNLVDNFSEFLRISLEILGKSSFLVIFDDIDIDSTKGWAVLETIRKYLTTARLITILSGDLKLYSAVIRQKKWKNFGSEILRYEGTELKGYDIRKLQGFNNMVTELTSQYLLKIMQPRLRVHLATVLEKLRTNLGLDIVVYRNLETKEGNEITRLYQEIFREFGIRSPTESEVFETFILSQPLRSQIQFLSVISASLRGRRAANVKALAVKNEEGHLSDVFLSDLLEKDVDINLARNAPKYWNIVILELLLKERKLNDLYQLQPTTTDDSLNACLFSLSMLLSESIKQNNLFLIFDYFIRIGALRNLSSIIPYNEDTSGKVVSKSIEELCQKSGLLKEGVLRDITGSMQSYLFGYLETNNDLVDSSANFIQLLGLAEAARQGYTDRLDVVFSLKVTTSKRILGHIPGFSASYTYKNESRVAYSIFMLISTIGELVKRYETVLINEDGAGKLYGIKTALMDLSQLRTYIMPGFGRGGQSAASNEVRSMPVSSDIDSMNSETNDDNSSVKLDGTEDQLARLVLKWIDSANASMTVSPYLLGKMFTRFFYALNNIAQRAPRGILLGDLFHHQIVAFLNAVALEDAKENFYRVPDLNINNTNFDDGIFVSNLKKLSHALRNPFYLDKPLGFSRWFLGCPLLLAYLNPKRNTKLVDELLNFSGEYIDGESFELSVSSILNEVSIKGGERKKSTNKEGYEIFIGSPDMLSSKSELADRLRDAGYPFEWFQVSWGGNAKSRNYEIRKYISSVFGSDGSAIKEFRRYLAENNIKW